MDTVRAIISLAGQIGWLLYQLDVKSSFLNGELKEEVYVNQPQVFEVEGKEEKLQSMVILKKKVLIKARANQPYLKNFDMSECKPKDTPLVFNEKLMKEDESSKVDATLYRSLVWKLLYLTSTRLGIMFAARLLTREAIEDGEESLRPFLACFLGYVAFGATLPLVHHLIAWMAGCHQSLFSAFPQCVISHVYSVPLHME
ncbi:retrovirus-related pol polyprotein from transposon TNT 1-94 [Tanacetum coccineum]